MNKLSNGVIDLLSSSVKSRFSIKKFNENKSLSQLKRKRWKKCFPKRENVFCLHNNTFYYFFKSLMPVRKSRSTLFDRTEVEKGK